MPRINVELDGAGRLKREFRKKPKQVTKEMHKALGRSAEKIASDARRNAPANTGSLRGSIKAQMRGVAKWRVLVNSEYGLYVHEGTDPHFPPWQENTALADWASDKGIPPFLVAKSIAEHGTEAQPFLKDAVEENENYINNRVSAALDRAIKS